jgi:outer membrane protein TolC
MASNLEFPRPGLEPNFATSLTVRQGLLYPGKLQARRHLAAAATAVQQAELAAAQAALARDVRQAYARVYAIDQELARLEEAQALLEALAESARQRYVAGLTSQEAVLKAVLRQARLLERQQELGQRRAQVVAELNRLCNRPLLHPLDKVLALPPVPPLPSTWPQEALVKAPQLLLAQARRRAAAQAVAVAERELKPNLFSTAALASSKDMGMQASLGLGLEWPLWKKNKQGPLLAASRLGLEAAKAQEAQVLAQVREQVESAKAALETAEKQIQLYQEQLLPLAETALAAARAAFLAGQADFSTVIEDFDLWLAFQVGLAQRQSEHFMAWAEAISLLSSPGGEQ